MAQNTCQTATFIQVTDSCELTTYYQSGYDDRWFTFSPETPGVGFEIEWDYSPRWAYIPYDTLYIYTGSCDSLVEYAILSPIPTSGENYFNGDGDVFFRFTRDNSTPADIEFDLCVFSVIEDPTCDPALTYEFIQIPVCPEDELCVRFLDFNDSKQINIEIWGYPPTCDNSFTQSISVTPNTQTDFCWTNDFFMPTILFYMESVCGENNDFQTIYYQHTFQVDSYKPLDFDYIGFLCENMEIEFTGNANCFQYWHWDFGDGTIGEGQNIIHQYSEPGVYIVTLTNADPSICWSTPPEYVYNSVSHSIIVLPAPELNAQLSTNNNCNSTITNGFVVNPNPNDIYTWWLEPGMGTITPSIGENVTIEFTGLLNQLNTVYVKATDENGCSVTKEMYYYNCCQCEIPTGCIHLADETVPSVYHPQTSYYGDLFYINGVVILSDNMSMENCNIMMGPMAKIIIDRNVTIELNHTEISAGCDYMWDGIYIGNNSKLIINNNCIVQDATNGIVKNNLFNGDFDIRETTFKNNFISLSLGYDHPGIISYFDLTNCIFQNNTIECIGNLISPLTDIRAWKGISVSNCNKFNIGPDNTFKNLDYGIWSLSSDLTIRNNNFENVSSTQPQLIGQSPLNQAAIYAIGSPKQIPSNEIIIGGSLFEKNIFTNCHTGIIIFNNYNILCSHNEISNTLQMFNSRGIVYSGMHNSNSVIISNNVLTNIVTGVYAFDNRNCVSSIKQNSMTWNNSIPGGKGIIVTGDQFKLSQYVIDQNSLIGPAIGIRVLRLYKPKITSNTITNLRSVMNTNPRNSNVPKGIHVQNTHAATVSNNIIRGIGNPTQIINIGIHLDQSEYASLICNNLRSVGSCIRASGQCVDSDIWNNSFALSREGFSLTNDGFVGEQGSWSQPTDNQWLPNINAWSAKFPHYSWDSYGAYSPFWCRPAGNPNKTMPTTGPGNSDPPDTTYWIEFYPANINAPQTICSYIINKQPKLGQLKRVINEQVPFPDNWAEARHWSKKEVLRIVSEDTTAMIDPDIIQFVDSIHTEPIGILDSVSSLIELQEYQIAQMLNNQITYNNDFDFYEYLANQSRIGYYMNSSLQTDNINQLLFIAGLCPYTHGEGIFIARSILAYYFPDTTFVSLCESGSMDNKSNETNLINYDGTEYLTIYPNPVTEFLYIQYNNKESSHLALTEIYNISGEMVLKENHIIPSDNGINISDLSDGFYFIKTTIADSNIIFYKKFVKISQ